MNKIDKPFNSLGEKKRRGLKLVKPEVGTSVVVQWIRICLPVQGDTGLIPCPGRFYMPRRNQAHVLQPLSPRAANTKAGTYARAHKPQPLSSCAAMTGPSCPGAHTQQVLSPRAAMTEAHAPRACAMQHCKHCIVRSHCNDHNEEKSQLTITGESMYASHQ